MNKKIDNVKERLDTIFELQRKYERLPRAGWVDKGSRAKTNHAVLVPREEIKQLANDFYDTLFSKGVLGYENANLRHYMEQIAADASDFAHCKKCYSVYRTGWMDGKCPYCEANEAAMSMIIGGI